MPTPALSVQNLRLAFGGLKALDGAQFDVPTGKLTALVGPNGAGKTTAFNVISGLLKADGGQVLLQGRDILGLKAEAISNLGLVRTFQIARGLPKMTVFEHLMLYGRGQPGETFWRNFTSPAEVRQREEELAEAALATAGRLRLLPLIDNRVTALSGGQKKLLEIARALMADPTVLLFDEPAAGVNPTLAEEIGDQLMGIAREGRTVLLIEHDMALVERVADHVIVLANGRKLAEGSFAMIREDDAVQRAYLGGRAAA
jgi:ABC-type branched-subunit amino acid transport system ATPase component